jgi:hypothetical protein
MCDDDDEDAATSVCIVIESETFSQLKANQVNGKSSTEHGFYLLITTEILKSASSRVILFLRRKYHRSQP